MKINFSNQRVLIDQPAIFLAGPTTRTGEITEWRLESIKILRKMNFSGVVYVPEYLDMKLIDDVGFIKQSEWEREAMENAEVILFWVPRNLDNLPGLTTNVEFGYWLHSGKVIYGRPKEAEKVKYLDWLYEKETNEKPFDDLEKMLKKIIKK